MRFDRKKFDAALERIREDPTGRDGRHPFERGLYDAVLERLRGLDPDVAHGASVLALFGDSEEQDDRRPTLELFVNTRERSEGTRTSERDGILGPDELRWLVPYFPTNLAVIGDAVWGDVAPVRPELLTARVAWVADTGLDRDDEALDGEGWEEHYDSATECWRLPQAYFALLARIGRRLYEDRVIVEVFGRAIPVLIDEHDQALEVHSARATAANPPGVAHAYLSSFPWGRGDADDVG